MKRFLILPVLLLALVFPSIAMGETVDSADLVSRDGLYYKKFSTIPFTGKSTGQETGSYINGKSHGPQSTFYDNGQLKYKGIWKDGELVGPWYYYGPDGQLRQKGFAK
jgi:hypothetical protein